MTNFLSEVSSGGSVMWILLGLSFLLWAMMIHYSFEIFGNNTKSKTPLNLSKEKQEILWGILESRLRNKEKLMRSLIVVAPLLGLLGTVGGMIETFASLETMEMFKPGGGIADGISQALLTTQMGLIVAVPGMLFLKFIERKRGSFLQNQMKGGPVEV